MAISGLDLVTTGAANPLIDIDKGNEMLDQRTFGGLQVITDMNMVTTVFTMRRKTYTHRRLQSRKKLHPGSYRSTPSRQILRMGDTLIMHPAMKRELSNLNAM